MPTYLSVAPLARLPRDRELLTYASGEPREPGTLVRIPLGSSESLGIVFGPADPLPEARPLEVIEEGILDGAQLMLARWIAQHYAASLGQTLELFVPKGLEKARRTKPSETVQPPLPAPPPLSVEQAAALELLRGGDAGLLHGVTASGKTEVYLRLVQETLQAGRSAIVLVPEISLTPQTFERLEERFPGRIALWHSGLPEARRVRTWRAIRSGELPVIVGSRSAIFAPAKDLGLVVVDEEHDSSYKQASGVRYHVRTIAVELAQSVGAKLVLSSATPSVESHAAASEGRIALAELRDRVSGAMPAVEIVDLRAELARGNSSTISEPLQQALQETLERGEQAVLFLNRRGAASSVACRDCGEPFHCPACSTTMTYHRGSGLICHHCGRRAASPRRCPACRSERIRYFGAGTQAVEEDLRHRFPDVGILRLDRDTTARPRAHAEIFEAFRAGEARILLGTQMVTKGWDVAGVSLVGVLLADLSLTLPDFRAHERTYQLLSQVSGRSGRGKHPGRVIIQTYQPDHPVLHLVKNHDRTEFYAAETALRHRLGYPPFRALACLSYAHADEVVARKAAEALAATLREIPETELVGPAPAFIPKLRSKYYYQIVLKALDRSSLEPALALVPGSWSVDIDPEDLLA